MNFLSKQLINFPTLKALTAACFLTAALTSGSLLASPQAASNDAPTTNGQWIKHAPADSNAEIMMPAKPRFSERKYRPVSDEPFITVKTWRCTANGGQIIFTMTYHDHNQLPENRRKMRLILDGAVVGGVAQLDGNKSGTVENVKVRTYPGRKFSFEFKSGEQLLKSDVEVYLIGKRLYALNTIFKQSNYQPELSQKFFDTFNPFDPQDTAIAAGDLDASDSDAADLGSSFDGLTLPSGEEPVELK